MQDTRSLLTYAGFVLMAIATVFAVAINQGDPGGFSTTRVGIGYLVIAIGLVMVASQNMVSSELVDDADQQFKLAKAGWAVLGVSVAFLWIGVVAVMAVELGAFVAIGFGLLGVSIYWLNVLWKWFLVKHRPQLGGRTSLFVGAVVWITYISGAVLVAISDAG